MRALLYMALLVFSINNNYAKNNLDEFITESLKNSTIFKQLSYSYVLKTASLKLPYGQYDFFLNANFSYMDQSGALLNNYMLNTYKGENAGISINKKFSFGLDGKLEHKYAHINMAYAFSPQEQEIYNPVTSLTLSLPLLNNFLGVNQRRDLEVIELKLENEDRSYKTEKNKFIKSLVSAYTGVATLKESINVAKAMEQSARTLYKVSLRKTNLGALNKRHLLASEANLNDARRNIKTSNRNYLTAKKNLAVMINMDPEKYLSKEIGDRELSRLINLSKKIENKNPILKSYKQDIEISKLELLKAKNDKLPFLNIFGSYSLGGYDSTFSDAYNDAFSEKGYTVGLNFVWDIGGTSKSYVKDIKQSFLEITNLKYEQYKDDLDKTLRNLSFALDSIKQEYILASKNYKTQKQRNKLEMIAFKQGKARVSDVIEAQKELAIAKLTKTQLKSAIIANAYDILYLKGADLSNLEGETK